MNESWRKWNPNVCLDGWIREWCQFIASPWSCLEKLYLWRSGVWITQISGCCRLGRCTKRETHGWSQQKKTRSKWKKVWPNSSRFMHKASMIPRPGLCMNVLKKIIDAIAPRNFGWWSEFPRWAWYKNIVFWTIQLGACVDQGGRAHLQISPIEMLMSWDGMC
jgi:hypothetical protein